MPEFIKHANPFPDDYMPTMEEIFDRAEERFKNGLPQCRTESGKVCLYRSTDEKGQQNACIVGYFLPDDSDPKILEFQGSISQIIKDFNTLVPTWMKDPKFTDVLVDLQLLHDDDYGCWSKKDGISACLNERGWEFFNNLKKQCVEGIGSDSEEQTG